MSVIITMPAPPSVNTCFRNVTGKGRVRTQRYKTWIRAAVNEVLYQNPPHTAGEVMLDITIMRRRKNQDLDNMLKPIIDLLVIMAVMDDDRYVGEIRCRWGDVPGAVVEISTYSK